MDVPAEIGRTVGRYRGSWPYLTMPSVIVVLMVAAHVVHIVRHSPTAGDYLVLTVFPLLFVLTWSMPATVISTAGFRRGLRFRLIPWVDVATVFPAGPGDPDVLVGLRDGTKVSLVGVRQNRRAGVQLLLDRSRQRDPAV